MLGHAASQLASQLPLNPFRLICQPIEAAPQSQASQLAWVGFGEGFGRHQKLPFFCSFPRLSIRRSIGFFCPPDRGGSRGS
jgi:hypothetical protein